MPFTIGNTATQQAEANPIAVVGIVGIAKQAAAIAFSNTVYSRERVTCSVRDG